MIINLFAHRRRPAEIALELAACLIRQRLDTYKVEMGLALHKTYTFGLPLETVHLQWDKAYRAERQLNLVINALAELAKARHPWTRTIEVQRERLQTIRARLVREVNDRDITSRVAALDEQINTLTALLQEAHKDA